MQFGNDKVHDLELRMDKLARAGKVDKKWILKDPDLPKADPRFAHLLLWYLELRSANPRGYRFEPLTFGEIAAYSGLFGVAMTPFEVGQLRSLDALWMAIQPPPEKPK